MRFPIHVRPGSSRPLVGGEHDGALVVRVHERAVNGAATKAVEIALAEALDVSPRTVLCVKGRMTRRKMMEISGEEAALQQRLDALRSESLLP